MEPYRHILCALDLSSDSEATCLRAVRLRADTGARLTLLHVVDHFPEDRSNRVIAPENEDPRQFHEQDARSKLADLARRSGCSEDAALEVRFSMQPAWHEIAHFVREGAVDLLVLGAYAQAGMAALIPSTAQRLTEKQICDLLLVPVERATAS